MPAPIVNVLHAADLRALADGKIYRRGEQYHREGRVTNLRRDSNTLRASVTGSQPYDVTLWVRSDRIAYSCTCPMGLDGGFCKHCVAVSLSFIESGTLNHRS